MNYIVDRDYGAGILNSGVVYCTNCTFHNNKAKYGGAIYNQGLLVITNSSFYSNTGYGKGDDIVNVDDGIVSIDGKNYKGCDGDKITYMKSMSSKWQTVIKITCYGGAFVLGTVAGVLTANPIAGIAVGAAIGTAVGSIGSAVINSNVYDINFNRFSCAMTLILGSAGAGALGGFTGTAIGCSLSTSSLSTTFTYVPDTIAKSAIRGYLGTVLSFTVKQAISISNSNNNESLITAQNYLMKSLEEVNEYYGTVMATAAFTSSCDALYSFIVTKSIITDGCVDAICIPTVHYTNLNQDDINSIVKSDSNTFILSSEFVSAIKSSSNVQKIKDLIDGSNNKISFTANEIINSISTMKQFN